jgi:hypothetical protein
MKMIKCDQQAYGDACVYECEEADLVKRPYCGNESDMRDAVQLGVYANGQPKYVFVTRKDGKIFAEQFFSIGD